MKSSSILYGKCNALNTIESILSSVSFPLINFDWISLTNKLHVWFSHYITTKVFMLFMVHIELEASKRKKFFTLTGFTPPISWWWYPAGSHPVEYPFKPWFCIIIIIIVGDFLVKLDQMRLPFFIIMSSIFIIWIFT